MKLLASYKVIHRKLGTLLVHYMCCMVKLTQEPKTSLKRRFLMSHPKFNALADKILQRRVDHLKKVGMQPEGEGSQPNFDLGDHEEVQLNLAFPRQSDFLEVFNRFDPVSREVEWSFYTPKGEYLLQFSFQLQDHSYVIQSIHPCLLSNSGGMGNCLQAINEHLSQHYPPLKLAEVKSQPVIQQSTSEAIRN